jgi:hypothetical protein
MNYITLIFLIHYLPAYFKTNPDADDAANARKNDGRERNLTGAPEHRYKTAGRHPHRHKNPNNFL